MDASLNQDMTGTRLGVICECIALFGSSLIFGCIFSWKLTIIVFIPFVIIGLLFYIDIRIMQYITKQSSSVLTKANSVNNQICMCEFRIRSSSIVYK